MSCKKSFGPFQYPEQCYHDCENVHGISQVYAFNPDCGCTTCEFHTYMVGLCQGELLLLISLLSGIAGFSNVYSKTFRKKLSDVSKSLQEQLQWIPVLKEIRDTSFDTASLDVTIIGDVKIFDLVGLYSHMKNLTKRFDGTKTAFEYATRFDSLCQKFCYFTIGEDPDRHFRMYRYDDGTFYSE